MNTKLFHSTLAAAALALTLWMAPASSSHATNSAQCSADAVKCAGNAIGLTAACASAAITDGFTTVLCLQAFIDTGEACLALKDSCAVQAAPNFATVPTTEVIGNDYYIGNTYTDLKCNDGYSDLIHSVEYRMNPTRLVYLKIFCTRGETHDFNDADIGISPEWQVTGVTAERATCDLGELVIGAFGSQDYTTTKVGSFGVLCGEIGYQYDVNSSTELGTIPTSAADSVSMGCPRNSYLAGFRIYYDPTYNNDLTKRHVYGIRALCV